jgi:two-component system, LytTR family, sensor kinase
MPLVNLRQLLCFNAYYWLAIFMLGILSSWQANALYDKAFNWRYFPMLLGSELFAMLLTAILVIWSYRRLQPQGFTSWRLLVAVAVVAALYIPAENALWMLLWEKEDINLRMLISNLDTAILAFFVWTACYLTVLEHRQQLANIAERNRLSYKIQQLELQALSHQFNPHFTFNALNSLCALLEAKRYADAELMSEQLASFLRYSLSKSADSLVSLADELAAINAYLQLQKTRFGAKLKVNWCIDKKLKQQHIPALLLQPIIENAIKYAVANRKQGATITISAQRQQQNLQLRIADDGPGLALPKNNSGAGVGLNNIRNRLLQHFGATAQLQTSASAHGYTVEISLPWQDR